MFLNISNVTLSSLPTRLRSSHEYIFSLVRTKGGGNLKDGARVSSNTRPHVSSFLGAWTRDGRSFHFTFVVDNNTSIVFEVDVGSLLSSPALSLANNNSWVNLLSQLRFAFLASSHDKVTNSGSWETILATMNTNNGDNHQ
jgi:hypothetical protein